MPHDMRRLSALQQSLVYQRVRLSPERTVVLLDVSGRKDMPLSEHNQNIYCVGEKEEIFWQVQAGETIQDRDSFISLSMTADGQLSADRFFGNEFLIDPESGAAHHVGWHK